MFCKTVQYNYKFNLLQILLVLAWLFKLVVNQLVLTANGNPILPYCVSNLNVK